LTKIILLKSPSSLRVNPENHLIFQWLRRRCNTAKTLGKRPERYQVTPFEFPMQRLTTGVIWASYIRTATAASAIFDQGDVAPYDLSQMPHDVKGFLDFKRRGGGFCRAFCGRLTQFDKAWSFFLTLVGKPQPGASLH